MPSTTDPARRNNFDIVRLTLALIVVVFHLSVLSHIPILETFPIYVSSRAAVEGFFAISGYLIFASYERCSTLKEYVSNRAWRILPGYWLATVLCLLIAVLSGHFHIWKFLFFNLMFANFMQNRVPGLFDGNPDTNAINGSLWTIKIEVMFYCAVPMIVWCGRKLNRDAVLVILLVLSCIYRTIFQESKAGLQLPGQLSYFLVGALIFYHLPLFRRYGAWFLLGAGAIHAIHLWTHWVALRPLSVSTLTLGACLLLPHIEGPTRWGDFSYGAYVLHFPIIQSLVAIGLFRYSAAVSLAVTFVCVALAATFSWFAVERPSLQHSKSRRLRQQAAHLTPDYPPAVP